MGTRPCQPVVARGLNRLRGRSPGAPLWSWSGAAPRMWRMDAIVDPAPLKEIQKFLWSQGDFDGLARQSLPAADALVRAAGVSRGARVLDVGAGTGNVAVAALRVGASVTAS